MKRQTLLNRKGCMSLGPMAYFMLFSAFYAFYLPCLAFAAISHKWMGSKLPKGTWKQALWLYPSAVNTGAIATLLGLGLWKNFLGPAFGNPHLYYYSVLVPHTILVIVASSLIFGLPFFFRKYRSVETGRIMGLPLWAFGISSWAATAAGAFGALLLLKI